MNAQRIALGAIAIALLGGELVTPTRWTQKKLSHSVTANVPGSGLDENVLDSLPPIDKQALGSIDFLQYVENGHAKTITSKVAIPKKSSVVFVGWCGDPDVVGIGAGAFLSIDGRERIDVSKFLGDSRPDVVKYYNSPLLLQAGFRIEVDASAIGPGTHEIQFGVIARDRRGYFTLGGPIDLTIS